ncbi:hypothetical protein KGQ19_08020 [Catenulispora sp. NL8]|uniref:Uncharacterized protein n=1 Tax=Catenulispora pinistramenti TaxID=2705254 RepID=A0ABS5KL90_9ACTN|nr:hypothetical protein [Catenulispora pinistramenti]MBS2546813.1 hypothetical protein [Catenulispora pinistramenti]
MTAEPEPARSRPVVQAVRVVQAVQQVQQIQKVRQIQKFQVAWGSQR